MSDDLLRELAKAKAVFQQRAIMAAMGVELPPGQCPVFWKPWDGETLEQDAIKQIGGEYGNT